MSVATQAKGLDLLLWLWERQREMDYPAIRSAIEALSPVDVLANEELSLLLLYAYMYLKQMDRASELLEQVAPMFPPARNDRNYRRYLNVASVIRQSQGRMGECEALVLELEEKAQEADDLKHLLLAMMNLGVAAGVRGDMVGALRHLLRALALAESYPESHAAAALHHDLALAYRGLGFIAEAQRHFELSARYPRPPWVAAIAGLDRALLLHLIGDDGAAEALVLRSMEIFEGLQGENGLAEGRYILARIAAGRGELAAARKHAEAATRLVATGESLLAAQVQEELAVIALLEGDRDEHRAFARAAEELYLRMEAGPRVEQMKVRFQVLSLPGRSRE